jgi:hypothetical protein
MAIYKEKTLETGISVNYWRIGNIIWKHNGDKKIEGVYLEPFINEQLSKAGKQSIGEGIVYIPMGVSITDLELPTDENISPDNKIISGLYKKITESKLETREITPSVPAVEEVKDEEGNVLVEAIAEIPAVTGELETNEFAGAEEC